MGAFLAKKLKWVSPGKLDDCEENIITYRFVFRRLSLLCKAMPDIAAVPFENLKFESIVIPGDFRGLFMYLSIGLVLTTCRFPRK